MIAFRPNAGELAAVGCGRVRDDVDFIYLAPIPHLKDDVFSYDRPGN